MLLCFALAKHTGIHLHDVPSSPLRFMHYAVFLSIDAFLVHALHSLTVAASHSSIIHASHSFTIHEWGMSVTYER